MCSLYDALVIHLSRIRILFMNLFASTFSLLYCIDASSVITYTYCTGAKFAPLRYYSFISMSMNSFVILVPLAVA